MQARPAGALYDNASRRTAGPRKNGRYSLGLAGFDPARTESNVVPDDAPPCHALAPHRLPMKIWIDADAAPQDVKEVVFRAAKRLQIEVLLVANRQLFTPPGLPLVKSIVVREGADQADRWIVRCAAPPEIVITADIPLAAQLVERGITVIDPRGETFTANNIATRLSMRDFMDRLRGEVALGGGPAPYGPQEKKAFAATFDRLLTKALKSQ